MSLICFLRSTQVSGGPPKSEVLVLTSMKWRVLFWSKKMRSISPSGILKFEVMRFQPFWERKWEAVCSPLFPVLRWFGLEFGMDDVNGNADENENDHENTEGLIPGDVFEDFCGIKSE